MTSAESKNGLEFWASVAPRAEGGSTVTVFGELDAGTSEQLRDALAGALDEGDIEIDLRGCTFVDSAGIAVLVWAAWRLREREHTLLILGARPRVRNILELAGIAGHAAVVVDGPDAPAT